MSEKYKILSAMLSLRRFSKEDLVQLTGANPHTVQTVLTRDGDRLLDILEVKQTGLPGGQPKIYQLKPGSAIKLQREIELMYPQIRTDLISSGQLYNSAVEPDAEPPFGLEMAKDLLANDYITAETFEKKQKTLKRAEIYLEGAREEYSHLPGSTKILTEINDCAGRLESLKETLAIELEIDRMPKSASRRAIIDSLKVVVENLVVPSPLIQEAAGLISPYISPAQVHSRQDPLTVLLIDAIEPPSDELTDYVENILESYRTTVRRVTAQSKKQFRIKPLLDRNPHPQMCLLTVDSSTNSDSVKTLYNQVISGWERRDRVHILDQNSNQALRNFIVGDRAHYVNFARELQPKAMLAELRLFEDDSTDSFLPISAIT